MLTDLATRPGRPTPAPFAVGLCPTCRQLATLTDAGVIGHHSTPVDPRRWTPGVWPAGLCLSCCGGAGRNPIVTPNTEETRTDDH